MSDVEVRVNPGPKRKDKYDVTYGESLKGLAEQVAEHVVAADREVRKAKERADAHEIECVKLRTRAVVAEREAEAHRAELNAAIQAQAALNEQNKSYRDAIRGLRDDREKLTVEVRARNAQLAELKAVV